MKRGPGVGEQFAAAREVEAVVAVATVRDAATGGDEAAVAPRPLTNTAGVLSRVQAPVRPENLKLFINLTFFEFLLMLDQRTSPSSDTPL